MAQTTTAVGGVNCQIEMGTAGGAWTDVSGSTNQVTVPEQSRMSGEGYTFDGDVAIVKAGKREPVEVTFRLVYTVTALEAWVITKALFETAGGGLVQIRWTPAAAGSIYTIASGVITRLQYPAADATDANPIVCEFSVRAPAITS